MIKRISLSHLLKNEYPEFAEDIKYIEENLADLLYPFEERSNDLSFTPEKMGVFVDKPGDGQEKLKRAERALKKARK